MTKHITLVAILGELLKAPVTNLDAAIEVALGRVCASLGGRRGWLFRRKDAELFCNSHVARPTDAVALDAAVLPISRSLIAPWEDALRQGETISLTDIASLPEEQPGRALLLARDVNSCILAPIVEEGELAGFLCMECNVADPEGRHDCGLLLTHLAEFIHSLIARREAERAQIETANRLKATLAALPDTLIEVDAQGRYTGFHAGAEHLLIANPATLIGVKMGDVLPPDVARLAEFALREVLAKGHVSNIVYPLDLPGGRHVFDLMGSLKPAAEPGQPPTVVFLIRDVTQTYQMREELQHLGNVVQAMSNLVAIVDPEQRVLWVNPAFEKHTGWTLAEIRGRDLGSLVRCSESDPAVVEAVSDAIARRQPFAGQTVNQDRHGNRYWIEFNIMPLFGSLGELQGFVSVETVISQLKAQEAELASMAQTAAAAQLRLENAIHALPDGVVILDAQDRLIVRNEAYGAMFPQIANLAVPGITLRELLRQGAERGIFPAPRGGPELDRWLDERTAQYHLERYEDEVQLPDGRWIRRVNHRTSDGGCIALGIDITARRNQLAALDAANIELTRALAERDRTERRLADIMDGARVGTWDWDIAAGKLNVGGQWAHIIGRGHENLAEIPEQLFRDNVHPEDMAVLDATRQQDTAFGRQMIEREFRMRHRDGSWVWVLSRGQVTERDAEGRPLRIAGVHLDISERKRLEQEIRQSECFLNSVMDNSIAAIAVVDADGGLRYANLEAERILGLPPGTIAERHLSAHDWQVEGLDGQAFPEAELPYRRALTAGASVRDIRFAMHLPDGQRRVLSCNATPLLAGRDTPQVVVSFWDITDQLAFTARLQEALTQAEEMSRAKSIFLANMSHEIRTPLNGVLGMAEVLGMQLQNPEHKRMIATIRESGETLLTVLNSILDMSKIEAGKMDLEEVPLVMQEIVTQMEQLYSIQAEEKGIEFEVLSSTGCENPRMGDPHRVQQILNNLLHNAIKFTASGTVTLKVSCRPGKPVVFEVTDTGVGMTPAQVERAFESFEQADGSMTRRFGGTGLGLSIVRRLVLLMGGEITLDSTEGRGTRIRVSLPLPETDARHPRATEAEAQRHDGAFAELRILNADDNATNREVLQKMLAHTGAVVTQAENGQQALDLWKAARAGGQPFHLLLIDITMPVRDGLSTIVEIRRIEAEAGSPPVPAVAVTANAMPEQVAEYVMQGFDTHLAKPFKQADLLRAVATLSRM